MDNSKDRYFTPGIDPGVALPDLGSGRIDAGRFRGTADQAK